MVKNLREELTALLTNEKRQEQLQKDYATLKQMLREDGHALQKRRLPSQVFSTQKFNSQYNQADQENENADTVDAVRVSNHFRKNTLILSGVVIEDKFVRFENNSIQMN